MGSRPVFILGMHRSGTSALTGALNLMGVYLGPENQLMPAAGNNPKGFWEYVPFVYLNDEILANFGYSWNTGMALPDGWETMATMGSIKERARSIFDGIFKDRPLWGFKDPRTCLTFPLWRGIIPDPIECILCVRNPLDVAKSLQKRNEFPIATGAQLWALHVMSSFRSSSSLRRYILSYEDLMCDPGGEINGLAKFLGLELSNSQLQTCVSFLDPELKHGSSYLADVMNSPELPDETKKMYLKVCVMVRNNRIAQNNPEQWRCLSQEHI